MTLIRLQRGDNKIDSFTWFTEGTQVRNVEIKINVDIKVNLADSIPHHHPTSRLTQFLQILFGNTQVGAGNTIDDRRATERCYYHGECRGAGDAAFDAFRGYGAAPAGCTPSMPLIGGARLQTFSLDGGAHNYEIQEIGVNIRKKTKKYNIEIKFGLPDAHHQKKYRVEFILNIHLNGDYSHVPITPANAARNFRLIIKKFLCSAHAGPMAHRLGGITQDDLRHIEALEWDTYKQQLIAFGVADDEKQFGLAFKSIPAFHEVAEARKVKQQQALFRMIAGGDAVIAARRDQSLFESIVRGELDAVKMWHDLGANLDHTAPFQGYAQTPVYVAAVESEHVQVIRYLTDKGADTTVNDAALFRAAARGDVDAVRIWLGADYAADINSTHTAENITALQAAAEANHAGVIAELLANRADDSMKDAALFAAVLRGDLAATTGWVAHCGADINRTHAHTSYSVDIPPIVIAVEQGHQDLTAYLTGAGADINIIKNRALFEASRRGDAHAVTLWRETYQADMESDFTYADALADYRYVTAFQIAVVKGHTAIVSSLLDAKADPSIGLSVYNSTEDDEEGVSVLKTATARLTALQQAAQAAGKEPDLQKVANYENIIQLLPAAN